jgi:outer membrane protein assembly factor BamB
MTFRRLALLLLLSVAAPLPLILSAEPGVGWRGNWTGLYPDARPPLEWSRLPRGVLNDLRAQADKPDMRASETAPLLENGLVRGWLALGPFPVKDVEKDLEQAQLDGEADVQPSTGDRVGELTWKPLPVKVDDRWSFGEVDFPRADLAAAVGGYKPNQAAYAHTYLYAPRGGSLRAVVEHTNGLKAWLNGQVVYRFAKRGVALGNYINISRLEFGLTHAAAPRFELDLKPGWNRLLFKVTTEPTAGWQQQRFAMRLQERPDVPYESKNVLWMTELPHRSNASPIIVGDRLFVMAEPDELLCIDKPSGKILWSAANNYYEALTPAERQANSAFKDKVDPLIAELKTTKDFIKRVELRHTIQQRLKEIDTDRFAWKGNDHFEAHFGIVGFTTPTPVSDGKHVWVWCGNGIAACYDLAGNRKWITRVETSELSYASSPALVDGVLVVFLNKLFGLDAATGKVLWEQRRVTINNGAVLPGRMAGVGVVVTQPGAVVRARDGVILYTGRRSVGSDPGWSPGVVLGDVLYQPNYGVCNLQTFDFTGASGDDWKPKLGPIIDVPDAVHRRDGKWVDRSTAGSPLVHDGLAYVIDTYGALFCFDLKANKTVYYQETDLRGLFHYNSIPVAASVTLVGKHLVVMDTQGTALILEPGRTFKQVAKNRLATQLDRPWPIPAQETIAYAAPVADGNRLYLRGERYLYCIGEK